MSLTKKAMITLATALITTGFTAASFAAADVAGSFAAKPVGPDPGPIITCVPEVFGVYCYPRPIGH